MKYSTIATAALALLASPAMANPAVNSWPWEDTTVDDGIAYTNRNMSCEKATPTGELSAPILKGSKTFLVFRCTYFDDWKKLPETVNLRPQCVPFWPRYSCSMQDCRNHLAKIETNTRHGTFHLMTACAVQNEPGGTWQFDDSPND